jgi:hypothetical protein
MAACYRVAKAATEGIATQDWSSEVTAAATKELLTPLNSRRTSEEE